MARMTIQLTCEESSSFTMSVKVQWLYFDTELGKLAMPICRGDDWHQRLVCPLKAVPVRTKFEGDTGCLHFARYQEVVEFGQWLIEGEAEVQEGFRTMWP